MIYLIYEILVLLLHTFSMMLILFQNIKDSWSITMCNRFSFLTVQSFTLNWINFLIQVFLIVDNRKPNGFIRIFYFYSLSLALFVGVAYWIFKFLAWCIFKMKLGGGPGGSGGTNIFVKFYLHGGTFIMLLILNLLRPDNRQIANIKTSSWYDLLATFLLIAWYFLVLYLHYRRFHLFVYPPIRKLKKMWQKIVIVISIFLMLYCCTQAIKLILK